uniref:hypothetical protein n=1 Tax=Hassallia byssoidea TaxID=482630 RepID=UPI001F1C2F84|nr:hypothetical protein [Hassalia byssoidea]
MPVITIRETQKTETGFDAVLIFDGGEYLITITDPFTPQEEKLLEWYFEDWITFPFTDITLAEAAAVSVQTYGVRLFQQVFGQNQAYSEYRQLRRDLSELSIEIVGKTPEFHALHWEALHDPELTRSLAVECVMVRKSVKPAPISTNVQPFALEICIEGKRSPDRGVNHALLLSPLEKLSTPTAKAHLLDF